METLRLDHVSKVFKGKKKKEPDVIAVNDFNLTVEDNEFIVFVGPSGCGKSTTLRMIAGLEDITSGNLYFEGEKANNIEAQYRNIAMVFQNYALYPHMTAYDNMALGLKNRKVKKEEYDIRIKEVAKILNIEHLLYRKPKAMSGGERQRVALGRAIVRTPKVFLLDEPLSNLDAKLRASMRVEITRLYEKLKTTFIYVTHDQVEAMTMGTRIVVMRQGVVQQIDTPSNLFDYPKNRFVAGFLGSPQMNFYEGKMKRINDEVILEFHGNKLTYKLTEIRQINAIYLDGNEHDIIIGIRPDDVSFGGELKAKISLKEVLGNETLIYSNLNLDEEESVKDSLTSLIIKVPQRVNNESGDIVKISFNPAKINLFSVEAGEPSIMLTPRSKQQQIIGYLKVVDEKINVYINEHCGFVLDEINALDLNEVFLNDMHRVRINLNDAITVSDKGNVEAIYLGEGLLNNEITSTFDLSFDNDINFDKTDTHVYVKGSFKNKFVIGDKARLQLDVKKLSIIGDDNLSIYDQELKEKPLDKYGVKEIR